MGRPRLGRLVHKAQFQQLLSEPARCRSAHFAAHHRSMAPDGSGTGDASAELTRLSTAVEPSVAQSVDNFAAQHWLGTVLPKRWAKRAVTRNLLRRLIRTEMEGRLPGLPQGQWLLRLRAAWPKESFRSADSELLRSEVRQELRGLFDRMERLAC